MCTVGRIKGDGGNEDRRSLLLLSLLRRGAWLKLPPVLRELEPQLMVLVVKVKLTLRARGNKLPGQTNKINFLFLVTNGLSLSNKNEAQ